MYSECHKLQKHLENLKNWFCERGYAGCLIDEQLQTIKRKSRQKLLRPKGMDNKNVRVPFVVTYHPYLKNIRKRIKKHMKHFYADLEARFVFAPLPFVSFCSV